MDTDRDREPLSFLGAKLPLAFTSRVVTIAPGRELDRRDADWRDALVVIEQGQIELAHVDGGRHCFGPGSMLWLCGVWWRSVCNPGPAPAVLVAVSRRAARGSRSG